MALTAPEKLSAAIDVVKHVKIRRTGQHRIARPNDPLTLLLTDEDCDALVGALAARAVELGLTTNALVDEILEFLLNLPRDLDDMRLQAQMIRLFDVMAMNAAPADVELEGSSPSHSAGATSGRIKHRPRWRSQDRLGLIDRRGEHATVPQVGETHGLVSAMMQAYGTGFNAILRPNIGRESAPSDTAALAIVTELFKQLRQKHYAKRVQRLGRSQDLHRLTFNARAENGGLESTTIFSLPRQVEDDVRSSIDKFFRNRGMPVPELEVEYPVGIGVWTRTWALCRRFWGGLDPQVTIDGQPLLDILKVPASLRRKPGAIDCRRFNPSQSISEGQLEEAVRMNMPFLSSWRDRAWDHLFTGWELREHKDRTTELARRQAREETLRRTYQSDQPIEGAALKAALEQERASWPAHPHDRARSWRVWSSGLSEQGRQIVQALDI